MRPPEPREDCRPGLGPAGGEVLDVLVDQLPLRLLVQAGLHDAGRRRDGQVGHLGAKLAHRELLLLLDRLPRGGHEVVGLLLGLGRELRAEGLHLLLVPLGELGGLALRLEEGVLLLREQLLRLLALLAGRVDGVADGGLPLHEHLRDGPEGELPQHEDEDEEGDRRPQRQAGIEIDDPGGEHGGCECVHPASPGASCAGLLGDGEEQADHDGEQRGAFDEGGGDDHRGADVAGGGGLAGRAVHGGGGELADAEACTDDGHAGAEAGSEVTEGESVHGGFRSVRRGAVRVGPPVVPWRVLRSTTRGREPSRPREKRERPRRDRRDRDRRRGARRGRGAASPAPMKSAESMVKM